MKKEKEIDLLDIIKYTLNYLKQKFVQVISVMIIFTIIPLSYYSIKEATYSSKMVLTTNTADFTLVEQISQPLISSIQHNNVELSTTFFNVPLKVIDKIKSMEVIEIPPHPADRRKGCTFAIKFISVDKSIFEKLNIPTLKFFNENSFIKKITKVTLDGLISLNKNTQEQIHRLDIVQKSIPQAIDKHNKENTIINDLNLGTLYQEMISLKAKETETSELIGLIDEFKTISRFTNIEPTKGPIFYTGIGIIAGILINILLFILFTVKFMINQKVQE